MIAAQTAKQLKKVLFITDVCVSFITTMAKRTGIKYF